MKTFVGFRHVVKRKKVEALPIPAPNLGLGKNDVFLFGIVLKGLI